ncbi:methylmalonyl-CoA mutase family protein [Portibacter marinus]|uniref:methylmalonyl-CoA mutase family protein n=1 Tax=Portibacter marinus TaxID=2898660 RepID=UPI001F4463DC|nr:methylmalonyl-CoA mutase family protein [Portibacter marinus]
MIGANTWQIVEHFDEPSQPKMLEALQKGANALSLKLTSPLSPSNRSSLFEKIDTSIIELYLDGPAENISSILDPNINATVPLKYKEALKNNEARLTYEVGKVSHIDFEDQCIQLLKKIQNHLDSTLSIRYILSNQYLQNIIHLRVLKLLIRHLIESNQGSKTRIRLVACMDKYPEHTSVEEDLVYASIQLMSSVIGSADAIQLSISDKKQRDEVFTRRITRNLHHLAAYEAKMDLIDDPMRGSYFIEEETCTIAEDIWNKFII